MPALADELAEVVLDPPDRVFADAATLDLGGREIRLAYLGRGHTDNDIVVSIPDADVLCAGDLLENGAPPWFGDGYPMDWPATAEARPGADRRARPWSARGTATTPGARSWRRRWRSSGPSPRWRRGCTPATWTSRRRSPRRRIPAAAAREPIERALAQLRGELDRSSAARAPLPETRTTQRPRAWPATIASSAGSSVSRSTSVIPSSMPRGARSVARRFQSARRGPIAMFAESMPSSATPRRMNGKTVVDELRAARVAGRRDRRADPQRPEHVGQRRRADRVHGARPARGVQRATRRGDLVAGEDPRRTEVREAARLVGLAGGGPDLVAARGQDARRPWSPRRPTRPSPAPGRRRAAGRAPPAPGRSSRR